MLDLYECEVLSVVRMYREGGAQRVASFINQVRDRRGNAFADKLRLDAWEKIKDDTTSTAVQTATQRSKTKSR